MQHGGFKIWLPVLAQLRTKTISIQLPVFVCKSGGLLKITLF